MTKMQQDFSSCFSYLNKNLEIGSILFNEGFLMPVSWVQKSLGIKYKIIFGSFVVVFG